MGGTIIECTGGKDKLDPPVRVIWKTIPNGARPATRARQETTMITTASRSTLAMVGLVATVVVAGLSHVAAAEGGWREATLNALYRGKLGEIRSRLEQKGFIVQEGSVSFPPILEMCCQCELPTCYANNASTTYGLFALPPAPNQDPSVKNPYAEWFTEDNNLEAGWSYWWRLRPDEAAVFLGPTPPKVDYYGFTAYLYDRYLPDLAEGKPCQCQSGFRCPTRQQPESILHRFPVYSSLGDTLNQVTISLPGGAPDPYGENVAIILAADQNTERAVRAALIASGYPAESINLLPISPSIASLGLGPEDDSLSLLMRANPVPGTDITAYYSVPKTFLRISPAVPVPEEKLDPIPPPQIRVRGTGETELALLPAVEELKQAIIAKYPGYTAREITMATLPEGYNCLENLQNCLADNRDTFYISPAYNTRTQIPYQDLTLKQGSGEFYIAYGVIHPEVNKATYSNISVLGWGRRAAPVVVSNADMMGSAQYYLGSGADPATADKIYAFKITRPADGNDLGCLDPEEPCRDVGYDCSEGIASEEPIALVFRAYVEPATAVGPALGEVILDRILKFSPIP